MKEAPDAVVLALHRQLPSRGYTEIAVNGKLRLHRGYSNCPAAAAEGLSHHCQYNVGQTAGHLCGKVVACWGVHAYCSIHMQFVKDIVYLTACQQRKHRSRRMGQQEADVNWSGLLALGPFLRHKPKTLV